MSGTVFDREHCWGPERPRRLWGKVIGCQPEAVAEVTIANAVRVYIVVGLGGSGFRTTLKTRN